MARILVIDSYDSFVYNIVQYLGELGAEPVVVRNDQLTVNEAVALAPDGVLLSPGLVALKRPESSAMPFVRSREMFQCSVCAWVIKQLVMCMAETLFALRISCMARPLLLHTTTQVYLKDCLRR